MNKLRKWRRRWLWRYYLRKAWTKARGDYGQFLSNVGFYIAYGNLPNRILEPCFKPLHRRLWLKEY